jgi:hypothetical protein
MNKTGAVIILSACLILAGCNPDDLDQAKKLSRQIKTERQLHDAVVGFLGNDAWQSLMALKTDPQPTKAENVAMQLNQNALTLATPSTDVITLKKQLAAALASAQGAEDLLAQKNEEVISLKGQLNEAIAKTDQEDQTMQKLAAEADADYEQVHAWFGIPYLIKQNMKIALVILIPLGLLLIFSFVAKFIPYPPAQIAGTIITDIFSVLWTCVKDIAYVFKWAYLEAWNILDPVTVQTQAPATTTKTS